MNKICTNIKQSRKLTELGIDVNTADIFWTYDFTINDINGLNVISDNFKPEENDISAWSLTALSEFILPSVTDDDGNNYKFYLSKDGINRWIAYYKGNDASIHICEESDDMIDVIFEMVCWLKTEKYI